MIKAMIVDDEPPAIRELRRLLAEFDDIRVVGDAVSLDVARGLLLRTRPDVVFLDIRIGRKSGFELLPDIDPEVAVVFVTAYDDFAVRAFEASAVDYLLKPVESARLRQSVERVRQRTAGARDESPAAQPHTFSAARWTFLDSGGAQEFIEIGSITHVEASGGGTRVFTKDGRVRDDSRSLLEWERRFGTGDFVRVHRSAIVNLRFVDRVEPWFHYSYRITLRGWPEPVQMSRRHANRLRESLR
jgi:two-component system LytT family response regulator